MDWMTEAEKEVYETYEEKWPDGKPVWDFFNEPPNPLVGPQKPGTGRYVHVPLDGGKMTENLRDSTFKIRVWKDTLIESGPNWSYKIMLQGPSGYWRVFASKDRFASEEMALKIAKRYIDREVEKANSEKEYIYRPGEEIKAL